jgi:septal ring factor EnvC (AmiA/AmiB activator)
MALTATLIAFATGLAAKVRPEPDRRWRNEVERLDRDLAVQKTLVEHWKGEARTFGRRIAELEAERDAVRNQRDAVRNQRDALDAELARQWHRNDHQHAQQQHGAMLAQQANMQMLAQQAQMNAVQDGRYLQAQGFQQLGQVAQNLLGAQTLEMPAGWTCTCIPDRASALRRR